MSASALAHISSIQNPLIKEVRKAIRKGTLTESGLIVAEGQHLYEEALRSGLEIVHVFVPEAPPDGMLPDGPARATTVSPDVMRELTSLDRPAGIVCLVRQPAALEISPVATGQIVVVLDGVQDPGNAGTIVRAAEAFGVAGIVALSGTVDLFSPKAVRAFREVSFACQCNAWPCGRP